MVHNKDMEDLGDFCLKWWGLGGNKDFSLAKWLELILCRNKGKDWKLRKISKQEGHPGKDETQVGSHSSFWRHLWGFQLHIVLLPQPRDYNFTYGILVLISDQGITSMSLKRYVRKEYVLKAFP